MSGRLETWLAAERSVPVPELEAAVARQEIYGGSLDTALLERGVMTEAAIWARLAAATGLPAPEPNLCDPGNVMFPPAIAAEATRPLRAVPVAVHDGVVEILCADPVAEAAIRAAAGAQGLHARLHIIPETRLWAMRQRTYGEPMPARFVPLLARAVGSAEARARYAPGENAKSGRTLPPRPPPPRWATVARGDADADADADALPTTPLGQVMELSGGFATTFPRGEPDELLETRGAQPLEVISETDGGPVTLEVLSAVPVEVPTSDEGADTDWGVDPAADAATEALCRRARDPEDKGRLLALRALRRRLNHLATRTLMAELREMVAPRSSESGLANESAIIDAIESLAELRDKGSLRALISQLDGAAGSKKIAASARQALVTLTAQDCGVSPRRWQAWAEGHAEGDRVEWLLDGLAHKRADIRLAALEELRLLAGKSFGYSVNGPKSEREAARLRFLSWWRNATVGGGDGGTADSAFLQSEGAAPLPPGAKAR